MKLQSWTDSGRQKLSEEWGGHQHRQVEPPSHDIYRSLVLVVTVILMTTVMAAMALCAGRLFTPQAEEYIRLSPRESVQQDPDLRVKSRIDSTMATTLGHVTTEDVPTTTPDALRTASTEPSIRLDSTMATTLGHVTTEDVPTTTPDAMRTASTEPTTRLDSTMATTLGHVTTEDVPTTTPDALRTASTEPTIRLDSTMATTLGHVATEDVPTTTPNAVRTTSTEPTNRPDVAMVIPDSGPLAGSTLIAMFGSALEFSSPVIAVDIGDSYEATVQFLNDTTLTALTPVGMETDLERSLRISLRLQDGRVIPLADHWTFTYRENPHISDIFPLTTLFEGGTTLTVVGKSLDAAFRPILEVTTKIIRNITDGNNSTFEETNIVSSEVCEHVNNSGGTIIRCPTPPSDIPDDIRAAAGDIISLGGNSSVVTYDTDLAVVTLYIGFKFDGYLAYTNISNVTDEALAAKGLLEIVVTPYFNVSLRIDYAEGTPLSIPGYFVDVIDVSNYVVEVGEGVCQGVEISRRLLICSPPSPGDQGASSVKDVTHTIQVHLGRRVSFDLGQITYGSSLLLIIGASLGGALLLIALTILMVCLIRRRSSQQTRRREIDNLRSNPDTEPLPRPDTMLEAFEMANQPDSQAVSLQTFIPGREGKLEVPCPVEDDDMCPTQDARGRRTLFTTMVTRFSKMRMNLSGKRPTSVTRAPPGFLEEEGIDHSGGRAAVTREQPRPNDGYITPAKYRPGSIVDDFAETGRLKRRSHLYGGAAGVGRDPGSGEEEPHTTDHPHHQPVAQHNAANGDPLYQNWTPETHRKVNLPVSHPPHHRDGDGRADLGEPIYQNSAGFPGQ